MKNIRVILAASVLTVLCWVSCRPDELPQLGAGSTVTTTILGMIVDESNVPMQGVTVCVGNKTMLTESDGVFIFKDVAVSANRAYICATKTGYFKGSRTLMVRSGAEHQARIMMLQKNEIATIDNTMGGVVQHDGVTLTFPANATGSNSDNFKVSVKHIKATSADLLTMMPGDLRGLNTNNEEQALASFGMIAVELTASDGLQTNLDPSKEVDIEITIPTDFVDKAPATIPLWHFDDATGLWAEEGEAKKVGDRYVGKVSHFSFWNCDAPFPLIQLCGHVTDGTNPISNVVVQVQMSSTGAMAAAGVGADGNFCGGVPLDETFTLTVTNFCGDVISTQTVGPFSSNTTLADIVIDPTLVVQNTFTVSGTLVDCDNAPVGNGYVVVNDGSYSIIANTNDAGTFSITTWYCAAPTSIVVQGYDLQNAKQSDPTTYPFATNISDVNLLACTDYEYYITYTFDGETTTTANPVGGYQANTYIYGIDSLNTQSGISFNLTNTDAVAGAYGLSYMSVGQLYEMTSTDFVCNITTYEAIGGAIIGNFSGNLVDLTGNSHTVSGSFKAIRQW